MTKDVRNLILISLQSEYSLCNPGYTFILRSYTAKSFFTVDFCKNYIKVKTNETSDFGGKARVIRDPTCRLETEALFSNIVLNFFSYLTFCKISPYTN